MGSISRRQRLANVATIRLLRSPLSGLLDRVLMLITIRGRRTGAEFTLPVQYASDGTALWVLPGHHAHKTWWRNLVEERPVLLRLRGRDVRATAQAMLGTTATAAVETGLLAYFRRFPRIARQFGLIGERGSIDPQRLRALAMRSVMVRVVPTDTAILLADERELIHVRARGRLARGRRRNPRPAYYAWSDRRPD